MVVQLAVLHRDNAPVLICEWLVPAGDVDDAEPSSAELNSWLNMSSEVIGAAMANNFRHPADCARQQDRPRRPT